jgi:DNA-binding transcriptional LysR family regulator
MNQLHAMRVFSCVVELGSFNLAARRLGLSPAAVTRSVALLEAHLNIRLLNRTTRRVALTECGKEYLVGCREVIEKLDEMETTLAEASSDPHGTLRIATPNSFATSELGALLAAYQERYTQVDFDVTTFDTHVDMVEGGFDVCFCDDRHLASSTLVSRPLISIREVMVASPGYLRTHGAPTHPSGLHNHGLLTISDGSSRTWELTDGKEVFRVSAGSALTASSCAMVRTAALNDMGIALLPLRFVEEDIARGTLVPILQDFELNGGAHQIAMLYAGRNFLAPKVRNFIEFVVGHYRSLERRERSEHSELALNAAQSRLLG